MQCGVDIGPTHGLDEGADDVVVLVPVAVIAHGRAIQRLLDGLDGDRASRLRGLGGNLEAVSARRASPADN